MSEANQKPTFMKRVLTGATTAWRSLCFYTGWFWHKLQEVVGKLFRNRKLNIALTSLSGCYLALLSNSFTKNWGWVQNHLPLHEKLYFGILVLTLAFQLLRAIFVPYASDDKDSDSRQVLASFIENTGAIVQNKMDLIKSELEQLKPKTKSSNKFKCTAHPEKQFAAISRAASKFLSETYGIKEEQFNITIVEVDPTGLWKNCWAYQKWTRSSAEWHAKKQSAAWRCLTRNEAAFIADIVRAANRGEYILSERDKRFMVGSAYVYPIVFKASESTYSYVVSITTYGVQLCPEYNEVSAEITKHFLREFCRRFEIELSLYTVRMT